MVWAAAANAQSVEEFYRSKTISIVTAASGSTYDIYSRLLARHMGRYLPGNPTIIVKNMPGAGGIRATNFLAGKAPKDGTYLGIQNQTLPIAQILRPKKVRFNMADFIWIGRITDLTSTITVWSKAPATTIEEVKKRGVVVGATGKGSGTYQIPTMLNVVSGTKFKVILGYKGIKGVDLAMKKGEVQGRYGSLLSWQVGHGIVTLSALISVASSV